MTKRSTLLIARVVCYWLVLAVLCTALIGCTTTTSRKGQSQSVAARSFDANQIPKIAVLMQEYHGVSTGLIEDEFIAALLDKGYQVASRSDIEYVLKELRFQRSGLTDSDAAQIGKMLNVPAVLIVEIRGLKRTKDSVHAALGARLVSVERAEVLWISRASYPTLGDLLTFGLDHDDPDAVLKYLAAKIAHAFPSRN